LEDKEFDDLKKKLLPKELQEYFAKNRKIIDNNIAKFEDTENGLSKIRGTDEGKAIVRYVIDLAKEQYRSMNDQLENNEMLYTTCLILKERIDEIESSLGKQGIKVDGLLKYDKALSFIDDYIKRSWEDREP
jgi:hypothetical protein